MGDQPAAIDDLVANLDAGIRDQVLLGVTGSGKTFTMANIIEKVNADPSVSIVIMGSADSNTGTAARNRHLSEARGKYIVSLLSEKYGIDETRVVLRSEVVKAKDNPEMDRAVIISFN